MRSSAMRVAAVAIAGLVVWGAYLYVTKEFAKAERRVHYGQLSRNKERNIARDAKGIDRAYVCLAATVKE